ncbi:MAG: NAD(P)-dependent oxidoreductase [Bacteroidota bacterium]|nr:NAD(P)-dependent oxidoreductase [Bacteroidota bacterium]
MKVLFLDSVHECLVEGLFDLGYKCDFPVIDNKKDVLDIIENYEGLIVRSKMIIDREIIEKGEKLRFIGRPGAGMENIDVEFATGRGIACINSPEGNRDAVGEHALGMILSLLNKINIADREIRNGHWNRTSNRGVEIKDKTIGIIGFGNMGSSFAEKIQGLGAKIIAYDKYKKNYATRNVIETDLQTIFEETDILSLHIPLTKETDYMINNEFINSFKKNIYIINSARGKILNTENLVENLKKGKVLGAALDVLEYEKTTFESLYKTTSPPAFQYLLESNKVILTPHVAGWTEQSYFKISNVLLDKIKELTQCLKS